MRRLLSIPVFVLALALTVTAGHAQSSSSKTDQLVGTWSGTYAGDGSGKYTMVLSRGADKKITGTLESVPDAGTGYTATFKSIVVDGATVKMAYDEPNNSAMEIQLEGTVDGTSITGSWKGVDTSTKTVVATGTFTGSKR